MEVTYRGHGGPTMNVLDILGNTRKMTDLFDEPCPENRKCQYWSVVGRHDWKKMEGAHFCNWCSLRIWMSKTRHTAWKLPKKAMIETKYIIKSSDGRVHPCIPIQASLEVWL